MKRWLLAIVTIGAVVGVYVWTRGAPVTSAPAIAKVTRTSSAKRIDPEAQPTATITGLVRDTAKQPLAGATVCAVAEDEWQCVQSGADGRYELANVVRHDELALGTSLATYRPALTELAPLAAGEQRTIDVTLEDGGPEVTGVVEDVLGGPIEKAQVWAQGVRVETDAQGRFAIWLAPENTYQVIHARATGYGPQFQGVKPPGAIVIALGPDSTIAGTVVDAETGAPVASARVSTHSREVVSGADGTFSIDGLASGKFQLEASTTTRYGRVERAIEVGIGERAEGVVVQVYPARSIVATIDVLGDPKVCQPKPSLSDWHFTVQPPWRDEAGRYHFDGVPPGFYAVTVGCGATVAPITVADTDVEVTWRIETGGVVKGKIVDAARRSKQPLFAVVELGRAGSLRPPLAMTAIDDEFELRGVPAGTYTLVAKPGRGGKTKPQTVEVANGATVVRDLVVEPRERGRVVGTVVDKTSRVGTATIQLSSMGMLERETVTARAGRFEVELPAGAYRVHGSANGRASTGEAISVTAGETTTVQIELDHAVARREDPFPPRAQPRPPELYQLAGRVVDPNGAPVEGAIVDGMNASYWGEHAAPRARALTKADGSFALQSRYTRLEVDVYRIGGGHTRASLEHGESNQIELRAKTTISGTVLRADGSPAPRFEVRIGEGAAGRTLNFDYTGGRFAIEDNVELPLVLSALVNGVAGTPVTIAAGAAKTGIVLRLPPAVTITGRVVDGATRAPIANVRIDGRQDRDGWAPWFTHADQVTDADGRFTIRDLPPGKLMLELTPPFDTWSVQTMNITVPDARADIGELGLAQVGRR